MSKKYNSKVLEICDNGDAIVELPEELMKELGWKVDDKLDYQMKDGSVYVTNLSLKERNEC
jgi:antitoxin component of MazEF toxin-antitoxin module